MPSLLIKMFGAFSISTETQQLSDSENRSHKVWTLLADLIYHRQRVVRPEELLTLLWGKSHSGSNPLGALKTTFHRTHATLNRLWPLAGHELIIRKDGGYTWNNNIPAILDIDILIS